MPIPQSAIGIRLPTVVARVERGRLELFAAVIGETDPVYSDVHAARAAGHPDLPVPPTFLFGLQLGSLDPFRWLEDLGVDLRYLLHGNQTFQYHRLAHAGETLVLTPSVTDVYAKSEGALEFVVTGTDVRDANGDDVARLEETLIVRHPTLEQ